MQIVTFDFDACESEEEEAKLVLGYSISNITTKYFYFYLDLRSKT